MAASTTMVACCLYEGSLTVLAVHKDAQGSLARLAATCTPLGEHLAADKQGARERGCH